MHLSKLNHHLHQISCFLVLLLCSFWASAQPDALRLFPEEQNVSLRGAIGILEDPGGNLTLDEVRARWESGTLNYPPDGVVALRASVPTWLVLHVQQLTSHGNWIFDLTWPNMHSVAFYGPFDATGKALSEPIFTGSSLPYGTRVLGSENFVMQVRMTHPGPYTVYARIVSDNPRSIAPGLHQLLDFFNDSKLQNLLYGLCYGLLLAMLVYNLLLSQVFSDRAFVLSIVSLALLIAVLGVRNGHIAHYLIPNSPWLAQRLLLLVVYLWVCAGILFAHRFLELHRTAPRWGFALRGLALFALAGGVLHFAKQDSFGWLWNLNLVLYALLPPMAAAWVWRQGFSPAAWYLAGQLTLSVIVLILALDGMGFTRWPLISKAGPEIGAIISAMVFALGMSKRLAVVKLNQIQLQLHADGLLHKSQTDPLTGVANRAGLEAQTQALFANGGNHTLILLDLDKFKPVNDIHGHQAGDAVLIAIAKRLHSMVRSHDLVARIGGDEFVLLLAHDHERSTLAPVVQRILKGIAQPVEFEGHTLSVGSSLGIATFPQDGRTLAELMHAADLAMYHVKKNGRGNFAFYEDTLTASPPGADTPSPAAKA